MERGSAGRETGGQTNHGGIMKRIAPILPIVFFVFNQMLKTKNELNVKNKAKQEIKEWKKNPALASYKCGRVTSVKTPPYLRASSFRAYMCSFTPSLWSLLTENTDVLWHQHHVFAWNQSDVNWCLYLEERCFLYFVGIQTTSKHWVQ